MSYFNPNEGVQEMEQNPSLQENTRNKPKKVRKKQKLL
ncbi:Transcriptional regulator, LytR [Bacillus cereus Rock3-29]|nr:Transcriptional regulator, LytR [Bacillus cereus Rock3-29]